MGFFDRMANGWEIGMDSLKVLKANKSLILFPILSGIALLLVTASFVVTILAGSNWDIERLEIGKGTLYAITFLYYVVNYFVIVFFNMALIHCARLYFEGEEVTLSKGLQFSMSRIGNIFLWALFSATVGFILRIIQENSGALGKIITGIIGIIWGIATFFAVPVIAYENIGPVEAVKRSADMMKQKWGEGLGATFSFGIIQLVAFISLAFVGLVSGYLISPILGFTLFLAGLLVVSILTSAMKTIFISAVYHSINGNHTEHYSQDLIDNLFVEKQK